VSMAASDPDVRRGYSAPMTYAPIRKIRSEDTWWEIRRAWERGETAASLALRYDVGLSNLWRRRAAEGWRRLKGEDPPPEPLEGWARYARRQREAFDDRLRDARDLARPMSDGDRQGRAADAGAALAHTVAVLVAGRTSGSGGDGAGPGAGARDRPTLGRGLLG